jgi:choline-sulfatase
MSTGNDQMNILFLMTDQHRVDHVGFLPGARLETPNLNRIADSVGFYNCVSVNPICTPARTALLTGKYSHQIGTLSMSGDLSLQHPTYMRALQSAGYWTAGVGKFHWLQGWHWQKPVGQGHNLVALKEKMKQFGLDHIWESSGKQLAVKNYCDYCKHLDEKGLLQAYREHTQGRGPNLKDPSQTQFTGEPWPFEEEDYVDLVTGQEILNAIDMRPDDRPFCIFGSFCGPHKPYDPPASYIERVPWDETDDFIMGDESMTQETKERIYRLRRAYRAMILAIDDQVGRIFTKLEEDGLLDNTLIVFTADHGEMLGDHNRLSKMQYWRQSVTVPAAIRHPGYLNEQVNESPVELTDLTATMLDAAGLDPQEVLSKPWPAFHDRVPCRSLMPIVKGELQAVRDVAFSECRGEWQMLLDHTWKYIRLLPQSVGDTGDELLYNLQEDPDELINCAEKSEHANVLNEFRLYLADLLAATPTAQLQWAPFHGYIPPEAM